MQYIHVGISEIPSEQFVESGQLEFRYIEPRGATRLRASGFIEDRPFGRVLLKT